MTRPLFLSLLFIATCCAQTVQVYSEFARLSESGDALAPQNPREILSPAVPRNGFSTFQLAIQTPPGTKYNVYIGQNPADAVTVTLYRRLGEKLEPVGLPYEGTSPQALWMDVWVDAMAPVGRVKLEPQIYINNDWLTYPMEVRVTEAVIAKAGSDYSLAPLEAMRLFLCGGHRSASAKSTGVNQISLRARNAQQDVSLAAAVSEAQRQELVKIMGGCDAKPSPDPEFYLRLRDLLLSPAWQKAQKMREAAPPR